MPSPFIRADFALPEGAYAVLFLSERGLDQPDYDAMDAQTLAAVEGLSGYLGYEMVRNGESAIFISYWKNRAAVDAWKHHSLHREAKAQGRAVWYDAYRSIVCKVEESSVFRRAVGG
jgi:heme-degrading monooxygenase HmoA